MTDTPTPRTDDFPRIGCIGHDCDACATRAQEFAKLTADLTACRAALRELVALKDATDALSIRHGGEWYTASYSNEARELTDRKVAAWSAARTILQSTGEGEGK